MSQQTSGCRRVLPELRRTLAVTAAFMLVAGSALAAGSTVEFPGSAAAPAADMAWQMRLPLGHLATVRSYQLVDGYLCATCSDGAIRTLRPDTGEYLWTAEVAKELETVYPPVAWRTSDGDRLVVTLAREVVAIDPATGRETRRIRLPVTSMASVALSAHEIFQVGPNGRMPCLAISEGTLLWQSGLGRHIRLAPVYAPAVDAVVLADIEGNVGAVGTDKAVVFQEKLDGVAQGWLAVDGTVAYVATSSADLHAIDLSGGRILWKYRLIDQPVGGPVVTRESVYQATRSGLHRIGLARSATPAAAAPASAPSTEPAEAVADASATETPATAPAGDAAEPVAKAPATAPAATVARREPLKFGTSWIDPEAVQFLAEWPQGTVVLHANGRLALVSAVTGKIVEFADSVVATEGLANPYNDAVLLTNAKGEVRCIRPLRAQPLTLAEFRAPVGRTVIREKSVHAVKLAAKAAKTEVSAVPAIAPAASATSAPAEGGEEAKAAAVPTRTSDQMLMLDPLKSERKLRK